MKPATYWRKNKKWTEWLGKKGKIIASTLIYVSSDKQKNFTPYSLALVDFKTKKHIFMGASRECFQKGELVKCVFRKLSDSKASGLINYGIKIEKYEKS